MEASYLHFVKLRHSTLKSMHNVQIYIIMVLIHYIFVFEDPVTLGRELLDLITEVIDVIPLMSGVMMCNSSA